MCSCLRERKAEEVKDEGKEEREGKKTKIGAEIDETDVKMGKISEKQKEKWG